MAAGDGSQLPATIAASRSVEKSLEEAAASGALVLSNRKLKEFPRTAKNYDLSDITHAGRYSSPCEESVLQRHNSLPLFAFFHLPSIKQNQPFQSKTK